MLVLLVFAEILDGFVQIIVQLIPMEGNLLTSGGTPRPWHTRRLTSIFASFSVMFFYMFFHVFVMDFDLHFGSISEYFFMIFASLIRT